MTATRKSQRRHEVEAARQAEIRVRQGKPAEVPRRKRRREGRRPGAQYERCRLCAHPERARVEHLLARGASYAGLAKQFGLSAGGISRHWQKHISDPVKAAKLAKSLKPGIALETLVLDENTGLLEHLQRIRGVLYSQFDAAAEVGDRSAVATLARQLHENLKIGAEKTGELERFQTTNITNILVSPAYLELRAGILTALRRFPEASQAVIGAFRRVESAMAASQPAVIEHAPAAS